MTATGTVAAMTVLAGTAAGADPAPPAPDAAPPAASLEIRLLAGVYLPRLNGEASLGPGAPDIDLDDDLSLGDQEPTPNAELTLRWAEIWEVTVGGFDFSTDSSGSFSGSASFGSVVLNPGDPYRSTFDITTVSADVAVALWRPYAEGSTRVGADGNRTPDGRPVVDLRISPVFGLRYLDVDQALTSGAIRESTGGEWLALLFGGDVTLEYRPQALPWLNLIGWQAGLGVGPAFGDDGGIVWQVRGGLTLQFTENVGVLVGYRLVELDVENDDYSFDGGLQGLFLAGSLRF